MNGWYYEGEDGERRGPMSLEQMRSLVAGGVIRRQTRVWQPDADPSALTRAGDFLGELATRPSDEHLNYLLPVNRSGWAIAAGYLGLFSFIPIVCYVGLAVSIVAAVQLKRNPQKLGWGRVITGFVISIPMSCLYTYVLIRASLIH